VRARIDRCMAARGLGGLVLTALVLSGCNHDVLVPSPTGEPDTAAGRATYMRACAPCHGEDGRGDGPRAASLDTPPTDLTLLAARSGGVYRADVVADVVAGRRSISAHRSGTMPVWATEFGPQGSGAAAAASLHQRLRIAEIAAFVGTLQRAPDD
jgi:mono/diheme cytochrome c family protein